MVFRRICTLHRGTSQSTSLKLINIRGGMKAKSASFDARITWIKHDPSRRSRFKTVNYRSLKANTLNFAAGIHPTLEYMCIQSKIWWLDEIFNFHKNRLCPVSGCVCIRLITAGPGPAGAAIVGLGPLTCSRSLLISLRAAEWISKCFRPERDGGSGLDNRMVFLRYKYANIAKFLMLYRRIIRRLPLRCYSYGISLNWKSQTILIVKEIAVKALLKIF